MAINPQIPFHLDPDEFEITVRPGHLSAVNPKGMSVHVVEDATDVEPKLFKRRLVKGFGSGKPTFETVLVAQLGDVKVYVRAGTVIVTRKELSL